MNPQRKLQEDIEPNIRPRFGVVQGGGETSEPKRGHLQAVPIEKPDSSAVAPERLNALEGGSETSDPKHGHLRAVGGNELKDSEQDAADDTVGSGYKVPPMRSQKKQVKFDKAIRGNSRLKKRVAIAGAAAGGSAILSAVVFLAMLPLKIEHIVNNLENKFMATSENAISKETRNLYSRYIVTQVMPGISSGRCRSTIHADCVGNITGKDGPVKQLYQGWKQAKLEQRMATDYGIVIRSSGSGANRFTLSLNGHDYNIMNNENIFDLRDTRTGLRTSEVSRLVSSRLDEGLAHETLWKRTYVRFKVWSLLKSKYGVSHCLFACTEENKFGDWRKNTALGFKSMLTRNVLGSLSSNLGIVGQCVLAGADFCTTSLDPATAEDDSRLSPAQKKIKTQLLDAASRYGSEKVADLIKQSKDGVAKYLTRSITTSIASKFTGEAAATAAGEASTKAIPVVGWVFAAARVVHLAGKIGPMVRYMGYAANASAAVGTYELFTTMASEMKSGHTDAALQGSFADALSTDTPYMQSILGGSSSHSATIFSDFLGTTYADSTGGGDDPCQDNKTVGAGQLLCSEENIAQPNQTLDTISSIANSIPGLTQLGDVIDFVSGKVGSVIQDAFNLGCHSVGLAFNCPGLVSSAGNMIQEFTNWLTGKLITSPFQQDIGSSANTSNKNLGNVAGLTPGRITNIAGIGAHVIGSDSCQAELGCAAISNSALLNIRNEELQKDKAQFDSMPMVARIFDPNSSYSLISRMAMALPSGSLGTSTRFGSSLLNPFRTISTALDSIFTTGGTAFAARSAQSSADGVKDVGYVDNQIPDKPDVFFTQNCVDGPLAKYDATTQKLDMSDWLNDSNNVIQDPDTGQALYLHTNPCPLILSSLQASGALADPGLLPPDQQSSDAAAAGTSTGSTTSKTAPQYCSNGSATGNEKIVCSAFLFDDFGYQWDGGHYTGNAMKQFVAKVRTCVDNNFKAGCAYKKYQQIVDCSGMVDAAIFDATGQDLMQGASTGSYPGHAHLKEIDISQAQPGDIAWWDAPDGHTEVIVSYDVSQKLLHTMGAHGGSPGPNDNGPDTYPNSWGPLPQKVFRVVP